MRDLKTKDVFAMSKILKKLNLKLDVKDAEGNTKTQDQMGAEMILDIFSNLYMAEKEILEFLGDLNGMTGEEMANTDPIKLKEMLGELMEKPGIGDFFKTARSLMK